MLRRFGRFIAGRRLKGNIPGMRGRSFRPISAKYFSSRRRFKIDPALETERQPGLPVASSGRIVEVSPLAIPLAVQFTGGVVARADAIRNLNLRWIAPDDPSKHSNGGDASL
jgi:hypothetical protein